MRRAGRRDPIDPDDPLVYLGGIREYWSLGECVANAYKDGSKLFK